MENEKLLIRQTIAVCTEIIKKLVAPAFKFPKGPATNKYLTKFLIQLEQEFGSVTCDRLVDACITGVYIIRNFNSWSVKQVFNNSTIQRLKENKRGLVFYQDQWLASAGLSRGSLIGLIQDRKEHPLAKYLYIRSEESTKKRQLNLNPGYLICQLSTLGWSPLSPSCKQCRFISKCQKETERKYPEIYRLRIKHGNSTE